MTKYEISDQDIEQVINGDSTVEMVAEQNNVPTSAVHNKKNRTVAKKKLSVGYQGKKADKTLVKDKLKNSGDVAQVDNTPDVTLDATENLKGFWGLIDGALKIVSVMTKKQIEYEPMTEKDIEQLAKVSNTNEGFRKLATMDGASALIVIGYAGSKIMPRVKVNLKPKHDEDLALVGKCKCEDCKKKKAEQIAKDLITPAGHSESLSNVTKVDVSKLDPRIQEELKKQNTNNNDLKEFLQRNLGSKPEDLAKADAHIEKMKKIGGVHIAP